MLGCKKLKEDQASSHLKLETQFTVPPPHHSDHYSIDLAKVLLSKAEHSVLIQLIRKQASSWEQRPYPLFLEVHRSHN